MSPRTATASPASARATCSCPLQRCVALKRTCATSPRRAPAKRAPAPSIFSPRRSPSAALPPASATRPRPARTAARRVLLTSFNRPRRSAVARPAFAMSPRAALAQQPAAPPTRSNRAPSCATPRRAHAIRPRRAPAPSPALRTLLPGPATVCRASVNGCDPAEVCPGNSVSCPADAHAAAGTKVVDINTCQYTGCDGGIGTATFPQNQGAHCADANTCLGLACNNGACNAQFAQNQGVHCGDQSACVGLTCNAGTCNAPINQNEGGACDGASCAFCSSGTCIDLYCEEFGGSYYCGVPGQGQAGCIYNPPNAGCGGCGCGSL